MAEDEIWDSWEDFADSNDLDKHVNNYLKLSNGDTEEDRHNHARSPDQEVSSSCENGGKGQFRILQRPVVHEEDQNRTAYIPQVKILRRPGKEIQSKEEKERLKLAKSQPARTLAEREAAYAEARKRIMGSDAAQGNSGTSSGKSRSEQRKPRGNKSSENLQNVAVTVERLPKGPDKTNKGFRVQR